MEFTFAGGFEDRFSPEATYWLNFRFHRQTSNSSSTSNLGQFLLKFFVSFFSLFWYMKFIKNEGGGGGLIHEIY